ncbi:restriction endonuclease, partial [Escherichia coli]|nr:restriction endonuclease [Escherichia coli]
MSRTLSVYEHESLRVVPGGLTAAEFDHLVRFNDLHRGRYFDVGHRRVTMRSFVGYLEVGELAIEIMPKA